MQTYQATKRRLMSRYTYTVSVLNYSADHTVIELSEPMDHFGDKLKLSEKYRSIAFTSNGLELQTPANGRGKSLWAYNRTTKLEMNEMCRLLDIPLFNWRKHTPRFSYLTHCKYRGKIIRFLKDHEAIDYIKGQLSLKHGIKFYENNQTQNAASIPVHGRSATDTGPEL